MQVCHECKGTNIEIKVWADANTDKVLDGCSDEETVEDQWCRDCQKNVKFDLIEDDNGN